MMCVSPEPVEFTIPSRETVATEASFVRKRHSGVTSSRSPFFHIAMTCNATVAAFGNTVHLLRRPPPVFGDDFEPGRLRVCNGQRHAPLLSWAESNSLPIYWINMFRSGERRRHVSQQLANFGDDVLSTRIPGVGSGAVRALMNDGALRLAGGAQVSDYEGAKWQRHRQHKYTFAEIGCTLSHIRATASAWDAGVPWALLVEGATVAEPPCVMGPDSG